MFGHALAELAGRGMEVEDELVDRAIRGLDYLLRHRRRTAEGLIEVAHPWETGCDDSARWDGALGVAWTVDAWREHKYRLVTTVVADNEGGALHNDEFAVGSIGFSALVAFNAFELDRMVGGTGLADGAREVAEAIRARWDDGLGTWVDGGMLQSTSGQVRTTDAFFASLVDTGADRIDRVGRDLLDDTAYGGPYSPAGAHYDEPTFDPDRYWRGPAWPQMSYLLWVAFARADRFNVAQSIAERLRAGMVQSQFAEYWNPRTGEGRGAMPQSWAALGLLAPEPSQATA